MGSYGPDGPWQALAMNIGTFVDLESNTESPLLTPMWPAFEAYYMSAVITDKGGGKYAVDNSTTAVKTRLQTGVFPGALGQGRVVFDIMGIVPKAGTRADITLNTSIAAADMWVYTLPDGRNYPAEVGILGLGDTGLSSEIIFGNATPPAIIQSLHTLGKIASMSACWHIGSAPLQQPGSFVLGGYDQSRAIGQVGEFSWDTVGGSTMFLLDVFIGTDPVGNSVIPEYEGSIWQNASISGTASSVIKMRGGKAGSVMVSLDATTPYINLPLGVCEEAARRLPVFWDAGIGLYLWNTTNPQYTRIVQSPAYLAFVFADRNAKNLTILVPMLLLNLTLESPIVSTPTPYFPCKPLNSTGGEWGLGRAFLQAAFVANRPDLNRTFLAQAPGPHVGQSVIRELQPTDTTFQTLPPDEFMRSWSQTWIITPPEDRGGLSTASIVGISVGAVSALVLMLVGVWLWRRHRTGSQADDPDGQDGDSRGDRKESKDGGLVEMEGDSGVKMKSELGVDLPLEMEAPAQERQELSPQTFYYELPVESPPEYRKSSDVKHGDPS
ncbi:hypothetical protein QBC43DRAFT_218541 [Cladorrhinum sp. PSN259]|nr:hypothetical protein QBC43DRAFT_218541 [Cladorrhinum sp. PSN259]